MSTKEDASGTPAGSSIARADIGPIAVPRTLVLPGDEVCAADVLPKVGGGSRDGGAVSLRFAEALKTAQAIGSTRRFQEVRRSASFA